MFLEKTVAIVLISLLFSVVSSAQISKNEKGYYFSDRIVIKTHTGILTKRTFAVESGKFEQIEKFIEEITPVFEKKTKSKELSKIKLLKVTAPLEINKLIKEIERYYEVEWAEPYFLYEAVFQPNDPKFIDSTLQHLFQINAEQAWDVTKGNSQIVIGIIDTGVDWDHPDLAANIWINEDEIPDNGIDDDNNGYVDDARGWDFGGLDGTPDNNPMEDKPDHGTLVAGIASAVTNNSIGIASIGFNSKIMAVKTSQDNVRSDLGTALISHGYEGIVYAIENGAKIINCSWGGYNFSRLAQEVIDYAVNNGVLIVAAAGNDNRVDPFYPASYKGVLSVGATNYVDQKASFSNYGKTIDVVAPGVAIYSTWQNDTYKTASGTSMSSPLVAGLAALVADAFPNYTPLQIGEQIRVTTENIDDINPSFKYVFGSGRINAYNALSNTGAKSVRIMDYSINDLGDGDGVFESGENVSIELSATNFLAGLTNLTVTIENQPAYTSIVNGTSNFGSMQTLETKSNANQKLEIAIDTNTPPNTEIDILLKFTDGAYTDFQWISVNVNPTFGNQDINNLLLTLTSNGSLGFNDFPNNTEGDGLKFLDEDNLLFEGALIYGTSETTVVNCARNSDASAKDNDFKIIQPLFISTPGNESDQQGFAVFDDSNTNGLGLITKFSSFAFSNPPDDSYIILRYRLLNNSGNEINNFYLGLYFDFDMDENDWDGDVAKYDSINNFAYIYDEDGNPTDTKIGVALLSSDKYNFYAMDQNGDNGGIISWDGFSDAEKWATISSGLNFSQAGPSDISVTISGGPFIIPQNDSLDVAFSICAAKTESDLIAAVARSKTKYKNLPSDIVSENFKVPEKFALSQNYPNPFNPSTTIKYTIPTLPASPRLAKGRTEVGFVTLKVYDILGREVVTLVNEKKSPGYYSVVFNTQNLPSGIYFYRLQTGEFTQTRKMILLK